MDYGRINQNRPLTQTRNGLGTEQYTWAVDIFTNNYSVLSRFGEGNYW